MRILFTRSSSLLSSAIRRLTGEPVSHCAIQAGNAVIQANLYGVGIELLSVFTGPGSLLAPTPEIVYSVDIPDDYPRAISFIAQYDRSWYDLLGLLYAGLTYLIPFLPRKNIGHINGTYMCTELVTEYLDGSVDSEITPYQLYLRLSTRKPQ